MADPGLLPWPNFMLIMSSVDQGELKKIPNLEKLSGLGKDSSISLGTLRESQEWCQDQVTDILKVNFIPKVPNKEASALHKLLDHVPSGNKVVSIIWFMSIVTGEMPICMYDVLKRAREWFDAQITFVALEGTDDLGPALSDFHLDLSVRIVSAETFLESLDLDRQVCWRGKLGSFDAPTSVWKLVPEFELQSNGPGVKTQRKYDLAPQMNVLALISNAMISKFAVIHPEYTFHVIDGYESPMNWNPALFKEKSLVVSLQTVKNNVKPNSQLSFSEWKISVQSGNISKPGAENSGLETCEKIYFVIHTNQGDEALTATMLDLDRTNFGDFSLLPEDLEDANWDEIRYLKFTTHYDCYRRQQKSSTSDTMTPSGDYMVLEAKEFFKYFDKEGKPIRDDLEELRPKTTHQVFSDSEDHLKDWPNSFYSTHHGVHYNRSEKTEENDRKFMQIQRKLVGLSAETASTCNTQLEKADVIVTKPVKNLTEALSVAPTPEEEKSKASSSNCPDKKDRKIQKLRNAVYEALQAEGITEKNKLFRPCFRKLFDICQVFAKDIPKRASSTKALLTTVAKQNVKTVIEMEKMFSSTK